MLGLHTYSIPQSVSLRLLPVRSAEDAENCERVSCLREEGGHEESLFVQDIYEMSATTGGGRALKTDAFGWSQRACLVSKMSGNFAQVELDRRHFSYTPTGNWKDKRDDSVDMYPIYPAVAVAQVAQKQRRPQTRAFGGRA